MTTIGVEAAQESYRRGDTSVPLSEQTIGDALRAAAAADPDRRAVVEGAPGELYEDDGETADCRGAGATVLRFEVRNGEFAIEQQGEGKPAFNKIAIRQIGG